MLTLPFAAATVVIGLAAVAGLGLAVTLFLRQVRQVESLRRELEGVRRMHKEGAQDVRGRLEEAMRVMREVQDEVQVLTESREAVTATVADVQVLKGSVEAIAPAFDGLNERVASVTGELQQLASRIGEVEQRGTAAAAGVESFREEWHRIQSLVDKSERRLAVFAEDRREEEERLAELRSAVGTLRGTVEERIAVQEERLERLETVPEAQLKAAAAGLDTRAPIEDAPTGPASTGPASTGLASTGLASMGPKVEPRPLPKPEIDEDGDDERGARWIFLVMAALLALALMAQYL